MVSVLVIFKQSLLLINQFSTFDCNRTIASIKFLLFIDILVSSANSFLRIIMIDDKIIIIIIDDIDKSLATVHTYHVHTP